MGASSKPRQRRALLSPTQNTPIRLRNADEESPAEWHADDGGKNYPANTALRRGSVSARFDHDFERRWKDSYIHNRANPAASFIMASILPRCLLRYLLCLTIIATASRIRNIRYAQRHGASIHIFFAPPPPHPLSTWHRETTGGTVHWSATYPHSARSGAILFRFFPPHKRFFFSHGNVPRECIGGWLDWTSGNDNRSHQHLRSGEGQ